MTTAQKIAVAFALCIVVGFLAFRSYRDEGLEQLRQRLTSLPSDSPSPIASASDAMITESISPTVAVSPRTVPTLTPAPATSQSAVLAQMNAQRAAESVAALEEHQLLTTVAQRHAHDMATRAYFSHTDPEGVTFQQRILNSGYSGTLNAENLGLTSGTAVQVVSGWMDSAGHRANLLNASYVAVGIGAAHGTWQGMPVVFVVAVFGNVK